MAWVNNYKNIIIISWFPERPISGHLIDNQDAQWYGKRAYKHFIDWTKNKLTDFSTNSLLFIDSNLIMSPCIYWGFQKRQNNVGEAKEARQ